MPMMVDSLPAPDELPDEGEHVAVLANVEDLGVRNTMFGRRRLLRFWFFVDQTNSVGEHIAVTRIYNSSLHEKSNLRKDAKSMLGRDPGHTYDVESLIGSNVRLVIRHATDKERTFAVIAAIMRPVKDGEGQDIQ